jgi:hypothetical protein
MPAGLRERWNLKSAQGMSLNDEAKEFKDAFKVQLQKINSSLRESTKHADRAWLNERRGERDELILDFQAALQKYSKRASDAEQLGGKVLQSSQTLARQLSDCRRSQNQAAAEWENIQPVCDEVVARIEHLELEDEELAAAMREHLSKVEKQAHRRKFPAAVAGVRRIARELGLRSDTAAGGQGIGATNGEPITRAAAGEPRLGLQLLYLTGFNDKSTENLIKVLETTPKIVTLSIAPCFTIAKANKGSDSLYGNIKKVIQRLYQKKLDAGQAGIAKVVSLTVFFSFHDKTLGKADKEEKLEAKNKNVVVSIAQHCMLLSEFLLEAIPANPQVRYIDCLERLAISPSLEDHYGETTFDTALSTMVTSLSADVLKFKSLEFRRSVAGTDSTLQHADVDSGQTDADGNAINVPVTHEFHHKPENADGYQVYSTDGPLVYSNKDLDDDGKPDEHKNVIGSLNTSKTPKLEKNPDPQTLNQFKKKLVDPFLERGTSALPDAVEELSLWRPAGNLQVAKNDEYKFVDGNGKPVTIAKGSHTVTHYEKNAVYNRRDKDTAFNQLEMEVTGRFLDIAPKEIPDQVPKRPAPPKAKAKAKREKAKR